jgi:hypothetical protein
LFDIIASMTQSSRVMTRALTIPVRDNRNINIAGLIKLLMGVFFINIIIRSTLK